MKAGLNKSKPAKSKQEKRTQKRKKRDTKWHSRLVRIRRKLDTIEMLLRGAANIADETVDESTPMDVVFEILRDNVGNIAVKGMLSMQFSEMIGKVSANEATANRLAKDIYEYLKDGKPRDKAAIEAHLFPGIVMKNNPQGKADLAAAFKLVYNMPHIGRFAQNGEKTDTRWTTIQIVKPAPLTPKS